MLYTETLSLKTFFCAAMTSLKFQISAGQSELYQPEERPCVVQWTISALKLYSTNIMITLLIFGL